MDEKLFVIIPATNDANDNDVYKEYDLTHPKNHSGDNKSPGTNFTRLDSYDELLYREILKHLVNQLVYVRRNILGMLSMTHHHDVKQLVWEHYNRSKVSSYNPNDYSIYTMDSSIDGHKRVATKWVSESIYEHFLSNSKKGFGGTKSNMTFENDEPESLNNDDIILMGMVNNDTHTALHDYLCLYLDDKGYMGDISVLFKTNRYAIIDAISEKVEDIAWNKSKTIV